MSKIETFKKVLKRAIAEDVLSSLKKRVPVDTGDLRQSLTYEIKDSEVIYTGNDYWKYVEYGTPPHVIRAKNAKALAFEWSDFQGKKIGKSERLRQGITKNKTQTAIFKKVNHPGTEPQPFVRPTLRNDLKDIFKKAVLRLAR